MDRRPNRRRNKAPFSNSSGVRSLDGALEIHSSPCIICQEFVVPSNSAFLGWR